MSPGWCPPELFTDVRQQQLRDSPVAVEGSDHQRGSTANVSAICGCLARKEGRRVVRFLNKSSFGECGNWGWEELGLANFDWEHLGGPVRHDTVMVHRDGT